MSLTAESVAKITASIVVGMIQEAAYRGVSVTAQELSDVIAKDPGGDSATLEQLCAIKSAWLGLDD